MKFYVSGYITLSLFLVACQHPVPVGRIINQQASLPASFGLDSLRVIASSVNKKQQTMSTLYGNSISVNRARSGNVIEPNEKLLLVTWKQKPDKDWFGANIPNRIEQIEQVTTGKLSTEISYRSYDGNSYIPRADTIGKSKRINSIFSIQASIMP